MLNRETLFDLVQFYVDNMELDRGGNQIMVGIRMKIRTIVHGIIFFVLLCAGPAFAGGTEGSLNNFFGTGSGANNTGSFNSF